jgi:CPA2 family monovalent cation:H+ antiporter-2
LPVEGPGKWLLLVSVLVAVTALLIWRRKFIYWHSELEVELKEVLGEAGDKDSATSAPWIEPGKEWKLTMVDCVLPDLADCQGKSLHELGLRAHFGCTVTGIERQGFAISLPSPDAVLYPRDKVLLLGTPEQVAAGRDFLMKTRETAGGATFEDVRVETIKVPAWSQAAGRTLAEVEPTKNFGMQMAGIRRGGVRILSPGADERLQAGDHVLVLGTPEQLRNFKAWLQAEPEDSLAAD